MHDAHEFLRNLALVLCVAAVTTVLFQRLRQPVVLGYLLAGMIIGPHIPVPLVADEHMVHTLSELGVILLMFSLGLDFSLRKLVRVGPTAGLVAVVQSSFMVWAGYLTAQWFGWGTLESIYAGAVVAISSTTIIVKAFEEQRITGDLPQLVFGILIVEDLVAILLMAILTTISAGTAVSFVGLAATAGRLFAFLAALLAIGLLIVPRLVRSVVRLDRPETTLVSCIGVCFAVALLAQELGYSVALGAFLAGSLVAESGEEKTVEHLVRPVRDMFAAIFFVSVGMMINPVLIGEHWVAVIVFTLVVVLGKLIGVSVGAFLAGQGIRTSIQAGMSLAQIGEFSFIIAGLGLANKATGESLYPIAVAVSALTTLLTPWLIRSSDAVALYVDRRLPHALQTYAALYGTWVLRLGATPSAGGDRARARRLVRWIVIDAAFVVAIVLAAAVRGGWIVGTLKGIGAPEALAGSALVIGAAAFCAPFVIGIVRCAQALGIVLGSMALPSSATGQVDLADAPRRALVVTLQLTVLLLIGAPLIAITQPFLPPFYGAAILFVALMLFGVSFWRSATNLQGHARAGAQVVVEALMRQARGPDAAVDAHALDLVHELLPGLGAPAPLRIGARDHAVGKTLAELNLRGLTTATVLAIVRSDGAVVVPTGKETLRVDDLLALAGAPRAIEAARSLLVDGPTEQRASGGVASPGGSKQE